MTVAIMANSNNVFVNPNNVAVETLKLKVSNAGIIMDIPAIDKYWVIKRKLNVYIPPPIGDNLPLGAFDVWTQSMEKYIEDLKWLLSLKFHKFWSNILYNSCCMDLLVSFLQEALPPYLTNNRISQIQDLYNVAYKKVFIIFTRLITNKESESEWISKSYLGKIIYEKYIFTIPILFDLCLLYGINNVSHVGVIIKSLFAVQPNYNEDLKKAIAFLKQMFNFVALQIDNRNNMGSDPMLLPENFKGFSKTFGGLSSKTNKMENSVTLSSLYDLCLHLSDCALTVRLFMEIHSPSRLVFKDQDFHISITTLYENTIPLMYKKLDELRGCDGQLSDKIQEHLDLIRAESVDAYRLILATSIDGIFDNSGSVESNVNTYLTLITDVLSEKAFLKDYNSIYPVEVDLDVLCQAYDKLDPMKKDFILNAIMMNCYEDFPEASNDEQAPSSTSFPQNDFTNSETNVAGNAQQSNHNVAIPEEAKTQSLISEVKDILPHLGDGFILKCLQFYNFNAERVICGVLENSLDVSLQSLDNSMPIIPEDPLDVQFLKTGIDRLNVFDNDEFDVMTRENIDLNRVHKGKKKFQHKNLSAMLNDKSHVKDLKEQYTKYSLISDDVDIYNDEYDDTYDFEGPEIASDAIGDEDKKPNKGLMPHRLNNHQESDNDEENDNEEPSSSNQTNRDAFCENPEDVRARYQARRDMKHAPRPDRDLVGRGRGQGQDKDVLLNRRKKEAAKSGRGNHNRRGASQWKRNQGMLPS